MICGRNTIVFGFQRFSAFPLFFEDLAGFWSRTLKLREPHHRHLVIPEIARWPQSTCGGGSAVAESGVDRNRPAKISSSSSHRIPLGGDQLTGSPLNGQICRAMFSQSPHPWPTVICLRRLVSPSGFTFRTWMPSLPNAIVTAPPGLPLRVLSSTGHAPARRIGFRMSDAVGDPDADKRRDSLFVPHQRSIIICI